MDKIIGIYKITSPIDRVYIGQSINILERWKTHKLNRAKQQYRITNSFTEYGVNNHVFEILEECDVSELNNREGFYQDLYDSVNNGLNCRRTKTDDKSGYLSKETISKLGLKGEFNPGAILVLNLETGIFYYTVGEAAEAHNINETSFGQMLLGKRINKTPLIRVDYYEAGIKCRTKKVSDFHHNGHIEVINTITKKRYTTVESASVDNGISSASLRAYLSGKYLNKTSLMYTEDFEKGMKPEDLFTGKYKKSESNKVINIKTLIEYENVTQAAKVLNICRKKLGKLIKNGDEYMDLMYLSNYNKIV